MGKRSKMKKVKCPKCNHEWETKSKLVLVTCPSCNLKIPNIVKTFKQLKEKSVKKNEIIVFDEDYVTKL